MQSPRTCFWMPISFHYPQLAANPALARPPVAQRRGAPLPGGGRAAAAPGMAAAPFAVWASPLSDSLVRAKHAPAPTGSTHIPCATGSRCPTPGTCLLNPSLHSPLRFALPRGASSQLTPSSPAGSPKRQRGWPCFQRLRLGQRGRGAPCRTALARSHPGPRHRPRRTRWQRARRGRRERVRMFDLRQCHWQCRQERPLVSCEAAIGCV